MKLKCGLDLLKGSGRAFCAGGDVVALHRLLNEGTLFVRLCKNVHDMPYKHLVYYFTLHAGWLALWHVIKVKTK